MSTDANNSATNDLRLESDRPLLVIPPGFPHPIFDLFGSPPGDTVISRKDQIDLQPSESAGQVRHKVQAVNPATMSPVAGATVNVTLTLPDGDDAQFNHEWRRMGQIPASIGRWR